RPCPYHAPRAAVDAPERGSRRWRLHRSRLMTRWVPLLLAVVLALPSANFQVFDGLPLSHIPEFVAFVLLVPLLASRGLRRLHARWLGSWPRGARVAMAMVLGVAVGIKLLLLASGTSEGFLACYRSPLEPPVNGPCERS